MAEAVTQHSTTGRTVPAFGLPSCWLSLGRVWRPVHQSAILCVLFGSSAAAQGVAPSSRYPGEAPFLAANEAAMGKMMDDMAVTPSGDVDADFASMMIPHHQGAIEMAMAELRFGRNEKLRRIAQEIIIDQQSEVAAMRLGLGRALPPAAASPTGSVRPSAQATSPCATP